MKMMEDSLVAGFVLFGVLGAVLNSWICCIISGVILACVEVGAHNFFHLKDTWRRFYFDLGLGNSYEWRITHFFSHHLYPNTVMVSVVSLLLNLVNKFIKQRKSK